MEAYKASWRAFSDAIVEHGAPYLDWRVMEQPYVLRCLPRLVSLASLVLDWTGMDTAVTLEEAMAKAAADRQPFLPALEDLYVRMRSEHGADRLFRALGQLRQLTELRIHGMDSQTSFGAAARALGEAMAAGGFASLTCLRLHSLEDGDLAALVPGLMAGPCVRTL